jgi:superfamily II DNA or RNA helicase
VAVLDLNFGLQPMQITPFRHQAIGFLDVVKDFEAGARSVCVVWATGTGKTTLDALVARWCIEEHKGRVLFIAHREELLQNCADDFAGVGIDVLIEQAGQNARWGLWDPQCVAASVQSLQGTRLRSWPRDHFKLIIVNECHHAVSKSYRNILDYFNWQWHLGDSAGIDRLDGEDLGTVYENVSSEYPYERAVAEKQLCRAAFKELRTSVDLSKIKTTGKADLSPEKIKQAITPHVVELAKASAAEMEHRRMLGFAPCVGSAFALASAMSSESVGVPSVAIHGDTQDRAGVWDAFRRGEYRVVWNYGVATEGTNLPYVSGTILCRPTKSRNLYSQMVGRSLRIYPGKEYSLNLDFAWISGEHELAGPTSLVNAVDYNSDVLNVAETFIADHKESDLMLAIERAQKVHRKRVEFKIKADERKARYSVYRYDPLAAMEALDLPVRRTGEASTGNRPTPNQIALLARLGVDRAETLGRHRAKRLLDVLLSRAKHMPPLSTIKQVRCLISKGIPGEEARAMSKAEASERLDVLFGKRAG